MSISAAQPRQSDACPCCVLVHTLRCQSRAQHRGRASAVDLCFLVVRYQSVLSSSPIWANHALSCLSCATFSFWRFELFLQRRPHNLLAEYDTLNLTYMSSLQKPPRKVSAMSQGVPGTILSQLELPAIPSRLAPKKKAARLLRPHQTNDIKLDLVR